MTVVLEAPTALRAPASPATDEHADATNALEDIIAAHRQALLALAPHQEERAVRVDTAWHMEHLGVLLCQRDRRTQTRNAARRVGSDGRPEESVRPDRPSC